MEQQSQKQENNLEAMNPGNLGPESGLKI